MNRFGHYLIPLLTIYFMSLSCAGELDMNGSPGNDSEETLTYRSLMKDNNLTAPKGDFSADVEIDNEKTGYLSPPDNKPPITTSATVDLVTMSQCNVGEMDFLLGYQGLGMLGQNPIWQNPKFQQQNLPNKLLVSIELASGQVLGSIEVEVNKIWDLQQRQVPQRLFNTKHQIPLEIPNSFPIGGKFIANLFVCVDSNGDKSCANENIQKMDGAGENDVFNFLNKQKKPSLVLFFKAISGIIEGNTVKFELCKTKECQGKSKNINNQVINYINNIYQGIRVQDNNPLTAFLTLGAKGPKCNGFGRRTNGCFAAGTKIQVGEDAFDVIENLPTGSNIFTLNNKIRSSLQAVAGPESAPLIEIKTEGGHRLRVTNEHPMLTLGGLKMAKDLTKTDILMTKTRTPVKIVTLNKFNYQGLVYNFELPGKSQNDHLVVAEGLLTGDLFLQQKLSGKK